MAVIDITKPLFSSLFFPYESGRFQVEKTQFATWIQDENVPFFDETSLALSIGESAMGEASC